MPIYVYQVCKADGCAHCRTPFEVRQKLAEQRLSACPQCGDPVRRVLSPPALTSSGADLSERNLARHGFTQYRKQGKGVYEKTAGKGPGVITDED